MILLYVILALIMCYGMRPSNDEYLSRNQTQAIKGIFLVIVFGRHIWQYLSAAIADVKLPDRLFAAIDSRIGQLLVVCFLFYSGYGVTRSIIKKGDSYANSIPRHRILGTWVNFSIAVSAFAALALLLKTDISLKKYLLSLIGWESMGNSNWYIFCIVICYLCSYIATKFTRSLSANILLLTVLLLAYIGIVSQFKDSYWYDTILCYAYGAFFAVHQTQIEKWLSVRYRTVLCAAISLFLLLYTIPHGCLLSIPTNAMGLVFCTIVLLITQKIYIGNPCLCWIGRNLFPLYIYQRLPMLWLSSITMSGGGKFCSEYEYLYVLLCIVITASAGYVYKYIQVKL